MKDSLALVGIGMALVALIVFLWSSGQLAQLSADRATLGGLGGAARDLSDQLGLSNYTMQREAYTAVRGFAILGVLVGLGLVVYRVKLRRK